MPQDLFLQKYDNDATLSRLAFAMHARSALARYSFFAETAHTLKVSKRVKK